MDGLLSGAATIATRGFVESDIEKASLSISVTFAPVLCNPPLGQLRRPPRLAGVAVFHPAAALQRLGQSGDRNGQI